MPSDLTDKVKAIAEMPDIELHLRYAELLADEANLTYEEQLELSHIRSTVSLRKKENHHEQPRIICNEDRC